MKAGTGAAPEDGLTAVGTKSMLSEADARQRIQRLESLRAAAAAMRAGAGAQAAAREASLDDLTVVALRRALTVDELYLTETVPELFLRLKIGEIALPELLSGLLRNLYNSRDLPDLAVPVAEDARMG